LLESAWFFKPLSLSSENLVSQRFAFKCHLYRYNVLMPPVNTYHAIEQSPFYPEAFATTMGTRHVSFDVKKRNQQLFPGPEAGLYSCLTPPHPVYP
jgi:hypothetical protein